MIDLVAFMRWLDDQPLDPFQHRFVFHIWRVGFCFKSPRKIAEDTGIGKTKVYELIQWALANNIITEIEQVDRYGYELSQTITDPFVRHADSSTEKCPPRGQIVSATRTNSVRHTDNKYTSLSIPNEEEIPTPPEETQNTEPHIKIIDDWVEKTGIDRPTENQIELAQKWYEDFLWLYERFGEGALQKMIDTHEATETKYRTLNPVKLIARIRAMEPIGAIMGAGDLWQVVTLAAEAGRPEMIPEAAREAVRPFWMSIKGQSNGAVQRYKGEFLQNMGGF